MLAKGSPARFILIFLGLFLILYYFNVLFFGITSPGNNYNEFLARHLNYISWLRYVLLHASAQILNWLGFVTITNEYEMLVSGHSTMVLVYSCLGLGIMSFFTAFVVAYPKKLKSKILFLVSGILVIQLLNILRFVLLGALLNRNHRQILDHHTIFNIIIYIIIAVSLYFWVKHDDNKPLGRAAN
jgi:exosortase/archaeosortase family protein